MTAFGESLFKTQFDKAAALAEAIARHHPFNDGNHRSGLAAAYIVLGLFNLRLVAGADEQKDAIRKLASGVINFEEFSAWLKQNSVLRSSPAN